MDKQIKLFLEFLQNDKKLSDNTLQSYRRDILQFEKFLDANDINFSKATEENIEDYLKELQKEGKKTSTASRSLATIRSFYQYLLRTKKVKEDPTVSIQSPKIEKRVPSVLTSEEVELLLDQPKDVDLKGTRDKAMLEFAYATGMKVTEIIDLNIDDVNFDENTVLCSNGKKARIIPLGTLAEKALKEYVEDARPIMVKDETNKALFVNVNGDRLRVGDLLFNTKVDNEQQQMDIESQVVMQMRLALEQIASDKEIDVSALDEKQKEMYAKITGLTDEMDIERGVGHAR